MKQNHVENDESSGFASSEDVQTEDSTMFECGKSVGLINGADDQLQQVHECIDGPDFVYQNFGGFEVDGLLGTELGGETLWSECSDLQSFGSQQPMVQQLQEFEVFSTDDQLRVSENLVTDNWASFDLSGYENF